MSSFKGQSNLDGRERPVVVNVCNFPAPVGDDPSLLSFENVTTLFHEFGHAMHGWLQMLHTLVWQEHLRQETLLSFRPRSWSIGQASQKC